MFEIKWLFFLAISGLSASSFLVHAEEDLKDTFKIAIGGYSITNYDSSMSLTDMNIGVGVSLVPEDTLGWDTRQSVFRIDGHYRFSNEHSLIYSWYRITTDSSKVLSEDIEWVDENGDTITIPTGASVSSGLEYDIYKIGYLWSFYHSDKVELAAGAGLHVTRIAVNLIADTTSSGIDATNVRTTMPLPVLSFGLKYHMTPRWSWYLKSEYFSLSYDDWNGVYSDGQLGVEYRAFDNFALGMGISGNSLKIEEETSDYKFTYDNRVTGLLVYLAGYF